MEVELAGDQEDDCLDGVEAAVAACGALKGSLPWEIEANRRWFTDQIAAGRDRPLMAEGGCPVHRFHRHIADRHPVPATTAMEQADRKFVRLLPV